MSNKSLPEWLLWLGLGLAGSVLLAAVIWVRPALSSQQIDLSFGFFVAFIWYGVLLFLFVVREFQRKFQQVADDLTTLAVRTDDAVTSIRALSDAAKTLAENMKVDLDQRQQGEISLRQDVDKIASGVDRVLAGVLQIRDRTEAQLGIFTETFSNQIDQRIGDLAKLSGSVADQERRLAELVEKVEASIQARSAAAPVRNNVTRFEDKQSRKGDPATGSGSRSRQPGGPGSDTLTADQAQEIAEQAAAAAMERFRRVQQDQDHTGQF